jgi:hypothetical protein
MDFIHQGLNGQSQTAKINNNGQGVVANTPREAGKGKEASIGTLSPRWMRIAFVVLVFSIAIVIVGIAALFYFNSGREERLVNTNDQQAVFLTNGQVYFGKLKAINGSYYDLQDIFYLNSSSTSSTSSSTPTTLSLVKLGCELHAPLDQMIITSQQVSFWENLNNSGKVSQAIAQWDTQNPKGLKCTTSSSTTQQAATSSNQ